MFETMQHKATMEPQFPDAKMHLVRPREPVVGRLVDTRLCTQGGRKASGIVRHIALDIGGTPLAANFLVGQSFGVLPPGDDECGRPHALRLYSIASPSFGEDGAGDVIATTVKRTIAEREPQRPSDDPSDHSLFLGVASNHLCNLNVGDEVLVTGPQGKRFLLPSDPRRHDYLFLATGTGIAPFRGMLLELLEGPGGPVESEIHLVMGVPYRTDLLYDHELRELAQKHPNFHYHTAISREAIARESSRGEYVHDVLYRQIDLFRGLLERERTLIYICGILGMQFGVFQALASMGLAEQYLEINPDLATGDSREWAAEDMKRKIRHGRRVMVEVY